MKIVMFGHKRIPSREGGVEVVVEELATRMVELGHEVTCINRKGNHIDSGKDHKGVRILTAFTIDKKGLAATTSSFFSAWKAARGNYDVVHIHAEGPAVMCRIPKLFGKKVIVTVHGLDWARSKWGGFATKYIKWGEKQAVKYADEIIVLSKNIQDYFKKTYNRDTVYIPNGVSKHEPKAAQIIKNKWGLEKDSYVLFVGRLVPEKGLKYLLEAWNDIKTEKKLVIVGGSSDTDEYVKEIKKMAGENVVFTGFQQGPALEELFSNAYFYVLPSDLEGMPLSLLEAMSYGNCCIVSDIPECKEIVEDNVVTFHRSNVTELRNKIESLLSDQDIVEDLKKRASNYICNKFNWDEIVERTLELYQV